MFPKKRSIIIFGRLSLSGLYYTFLSSEQKRKKDCLRSISTNLHTPGFYFLFFFPSYTCKSMKAGRFHMKVFSFIHIYVHMLYWFRVPARYLSS